MARYITENDVAGLYKKLGNEKRIFNKEYIEAMERKLEKLHEEYMRKLNVCKDSSELERVEATVEILAFKDVFGQVHKFSVHLVPWMYCKKEYGIEKPQLNFFCYQSMVDRDPSERGANSAFIRLANVHSNHNRLIAPYPAIALKEKFDTYPWGSWRFLADADIPMYFSCPLPFNKMVNGKIVEFEKDVANQLYEIWKMNSERKELVEAIEKVKGASSIKKIVCFGLGPLRHTTFDPPSNPPSMRAKSLLQHFTTFDMAEVLNQINPSKSPLPIYFQDPLYEKTDEEYLQFLQPGWNITLLDNPKGLYHINRETFVFCPGSPGFPIRQLVADLTKDDGGPAAIFCITVPDSDLSNPWTNEREIKHYMDLRMNPVNGYVVNMLKNFTPVFNLKDKVQAPYNGPCTLYIKKQKTTS